jgi:hypothetical protein
MAQTILTEAAPPEKEALYGALGIYPDKNSALSELIDNSGEYGNTTTIKIVCEQNRIVISDDGAGLNPETMVSMFRIKRNEHAEGETGKFGYGFKSATNYLGKDTNVLSKQGTSFVWGKAEPNNKWQYEIKPIPQDDLEWDKFNKIWEDYKACKSNSGTIIFIPKLKEEFSEADTKDLIEFCSLTFSCNFPQKGISIFINEELVNYTKPFGVIDPATHFKKQILFKEKHKVSIEVLSTTESQKDFEKFLVLRNNRLIASGIDFRIPTLRNQMLFGIQIVLRCTDALDDFLGMTAMKTIAKRQRMHRELQKTIMVDSGLQEHLEKISEIRHESIAEEFEVDLGLHLSYLSKKDELLDKLPDKFKCKLREREEKIKDKSAKPIHAESAIFSSVKISDPTQTPTKPTAIVRTNSEINTKSLFNIDLKPLGAYNRSWVLQERELADRLQLVIVFNWDKEFVRNTIINRRDTSSQDYINEIIAEVVTFYADLVDEDAHAGYNKVQAKIAQQKKILFGG